MTAQEALITSTEICTERVTSICFSFSLSWASLRMPTQRSTEISPNWFYGSITYFPHCVVSREAWACRLTAAPLVCKWVWERQWEEEEGWMGEVLFWISGSYLAICMWMSVSSFSRYPCTLSP